MRIYLIVPLVILLVSLSLHAGNGAGYGGGENQVIKQSRGQLVLVFEWLRDGEDLSQFAETGNCKASGEPKLCQILETLSHEQRDYLRKFATETSDALIKLALAPEKTKWILQSEPLEVKDPRGNDLSVSGMTKLGPDGEIRLHADTVKLLSPYSLIALMAHELGHKVKFSGASGFIDDNAPYGPFKAASGGGRELLDAFGASTALWLADHIGKVPVLFPKEKVACSRAERDLRAEIAPFIAPPTEKGLASSSPTSRGQVSEAATTFFTKAKDGDLSVLIWAKAESGAEGEKQARLLLSNLNYDEEQPRGIELSKLKNGNYGVFIGPDQLIDSGVKIGADGFHLFGMTRAKGELKLFVDGKEKKKAAGVSGSVKSASSATIGRSSQPPSAYWLGNIASVAIYPRALSTSEMASAFDCK